MGGIGFFFVVLVVLGIGCWITAAEWLSANIMYILSAITGLVTWWSFEFYSDDANQIAKIGSGVALIIYLLSLVGKDEVAGMTTIMFIVFFILLFLLSVSSGFIGKIFIGLAVVFCCYSIVWPIGYKLEHKLEKDTNLAYIVCDLATDAGKYYYSNYPSTERIGITEEIRFEYNHRIENIIRMEEEEKLDFIRSTLPSNIGKFEDKDTFSQWVKYKIPITADNGEILFTDTDRDELYYYIDSDYANETLGKTIFSPKRVCFNIYMSFHPDSNLPQFIKGEK